MKISLNWACLYQERCENEFPRMPAFALETAASSDRRPESHFSLRNASSYNHFSLRNAGRYNHFSLRSTASSRIVDKIVIPPT